MRCAHRLPACAVLAAELQKLMGACEPQLTPHGRIIAPAKVLDVCSWPRGTAKADPVRSRVFNLNVLQQVRASWLAGEPLAIVQTAQRGEITLKVSHNI